MSSEDSAGQQLPSYAMKQLDARGMNSEDFVGQQLPSYALEQLDARGMKGMNFDAFFKDLNRITLQSAASEAREHLLNGASRLLVCEVDVLGKGVGDYTINKKNIIAYILRFYEERRKYLDEKLLNGGGTSNNLFIDHRLFSRLILKHKSSDEQSLLSLMSTTFPFINHHKKASKGQESVNWKQLTSELLPPLVLSLMAKSGNERSISHIKTVLLTLKLLLTFVEDGADTRTDNVPLPKYAIFWHSELVSNHELVEIARCEDELLMSKSLQAEPRVLVCYGKPTTVKNMEITGYAMGIVTGVAVSLNGTQSCLHYYEVNINGDSAKDIKIGWAINGTCNGTIELLEMTWMYDIVNNTVLYSNECQSKTYFDTENGENAVAGNRRPRGLSWAGVVTSSSPYQAENSGDGIPNRDPAAVLLSLASLWRAGVTLGCAVDAVKCILSFYLNGEYMTEVDLSDSARFTQAISQHGICPVFTCAHNKTLTFNIGQQPYQYNLTRRLGPAVSLRPVMASAVSPYYSVVPTDECEILVNNFSSQRINGITTDFTLRLCNNCDEGGNTLMRIGQLKVVDDSRVHSITVFVGADGAVTIVTPVYKYTTSPLVIVNRQWMHLSIGLSSSPKFCDAVVLYKNGAAINLNRETTGDNVSVSLSKQARIESFQLDGTLYSDTVTKSEVLTSLSYDICDVRLWSCSRNADAIQSTMRRSLATGSDNNLLCHLSFQEGYGSCVRDSVVAGGNLRKCFIALNTPGLVTENAKQTIVCKNIECRRWEMMDAVKSNNYHAIQVELNPSTRPLVVDSDTNDVIASLMCIHPSLVLPCTFRAPEREVLAVTKYSIEDIISLLTIRLLVASSKCSQGLINTALGDIQSDKTLSAACTRDSICDPCPVNFQMIESLLSLLFTMFNTDRYQRVAKKPAIKGGRSTVQSRPKRKFESTKKYQVLLITLLTALVRVVTVNLEYVDACKLPLTTAGLQSNYRDSYCLVSRLLLSLCSLVSTIHIDDEHQMCLERCRSSVIKAITVGMKVFFPCTSYRVLLLEALLYRRKQKHKVSIDYDPTNGLTSASVRDILKYITPHSFELNEETGRMNILTTAYPHPLITVLSMSDTMGEQLLDSLLGYYGNIATIGLILNPEMLPTFSDSLGKGALATTDIAIQVGDYVERGPDWKYGDQDGGKHCYGIVVHISHIWAIGDSLARNRSNDYDGMCVDVVWLKTYCRNSYRWRVLSQNGDNLINDIQIIRDDHCIKDQSLIKTSVVGEPKYSRRQLLYTPEAVQNALTRNINTDAISKSNIINYIKEVAPISWQMEHSIHSQNVNALICKLTSANLISIYNEFYHTFSISQVIIDTCSSRDEVVATSIDEVIQQAQYGLLNHNLLHIFSLSYYLAIAGIETCPINGTLMVSFLSVMQGVLMGVVDINSCNHRVTYAGEPKGRLVNAQFGELQRTSDHASDVKRSYCWKNGMWSKACDEKVEKDEARCVVNEVADVADNVDTSGCIVLDNMSFLGPDNMELLGPNDDQSLKIEGRSVRQTGNSMTTILGNFPMPPNSGTYTWFTRIDNVGRNRRNLIRIFIGVATQEVSSDSFLGCDEYGWGLTLDGDLHHNSNDIDSDVCSIEAGAIVQLKYNSDTGHVILVRKGESDMPLFDGIDEETTLYPAWTLSYCGDCVSIISSTNSIKQRKLNIATTSTATHIGHPHPLLIGCSAVFVESLQHVNRLLVASYSNVLHPIVSVHLCQWLATIARYPVVIIHQTAAVFDELKALLQNTLDTAKNMAHSDNEVCYELLGQLTVLVCCVLGIIVESKISGSLNASINNSELSRLENNYQQFQEDSGHQLNAMKWSRKRLFSSGFSSTHGATSNKLIQEIINTPILRINNEINCNLSLLLKWLGLHASVPTAQSYPYNHNITKIVMLLFCADIYHSGYLYCTLIVVEMLSSYCKDNDLEKLKDVKVPNFIMVAWKEAVKIFNKIKVEFTVKKTMLPEAKRMVLPELLTAIYIEKIIFLLELEQVIPDQIIDIGDYCDLVVAGETFDIATNSSKCCDYIQEISMDNSAFVLDDISLPQLRGLMQVSHSMAGTRVEGLKSLRTLLAVFTDDTFYGAKCILLDHYPLSSNNIHLPLAVNDDMSLSGSHYMCHCPRSRLSELEGSFNSLYSYLIEELGNCDSISQGADSAMLVILSTLGVKLGQQDHALLTRVNIFKHLEDILENAVLMSTDQSMEGEKPSQYSVVTKAAMKLFILMALQVAVVDTSADNNQDRLEVSPFIRRAKSGPQTLSSSVFDTLYSQISRIVKIIDTNIAQFTHSYLAYYSCITDDVVTIISDSTLLLQAISKDKFCQSLLVKPPWVLLLLKVLFIGPIECQPSILRILSDLLVVDNLNIAAFDANKEELVLLLQHKVHYNEAQATAYSYTDLSGGEFIIKLLLKLCAKPYFCDTGLYHIEHDDSDLDSSWIRDNQGYFSKYFTGEAMIAVSSEAVALIRKLLSRTKWCLSVGRVLNDAIRGTNSDPDLVCSETIGALCVYGAHIDMLYANSPCLILNSNDNSYSLGVVITVDADDVMVSEQATPSQGTSRMTEPVIDNEVTYLEPVNIPFYEVKAINRFPLENLDSYVSEDILRAILQHACRMVGDQKVQEEKKLLICLTFKVISSLMAMSTASKTICQLMLSDPSLSLFSQALELAHCEPMSGDIKDSAMLEDYVLMCIQLKSRLLLNQSLPSTSSDLVKTDPVHDEKVKPIKREEALLNNLLFREEDYAYEEHEQEREHDVDNLDMLVNQLQEMGFPRDLGRFVLMLVGFDVNEAANALFVDRDNLEIQFNEHQEHQEHQDRHDDNPDPAPSRSSFDTHAPIVYIPEEPVCLALFASPSFTSERIAALIPADVIKVLAVVQTDSGDWNKVALLDHLKPSLDPPDDSVVDNARNEYAYAPSSRNGKEFFRPHGSPFNGYSMSPQSSESIVINCKYRILFDGALVRETCDLNSSEIKELPCNTIVEATEECVSSDGKIRLRIVTPVAGWITKHPKILLKITDVDDKTGLELLLDAVTNEFDVLAGKETDLCKRDSRYFGTLQGHHRHKQTFITSKSQLLQSQMLRIFGASSRGSAIKSLAKKYKDVNDINIVIEAKNRSLLKMYSRTTVVRILYLIGMKQLSDTPVVTSLMSLLQLDSRSSTGDMEPRYDGSKQMKKVTPKVVNLLQLVCFRGSPLLQTGSEISGVNIFDYYSLARPANSIHTDYVLGQLLIELYVSVYGNATINTANQEFLSLLLTELVNSVAHNVRLVCRPEAAEANMLDVHYGDDNDEQVLHNGSVHYALWASRIISIISNKVDCIDIFHPALATLVRIWSCVLYAASISLKQLASNTLAELMHSFTSTSLVESCLEYIPTKRLHRFTARRMLQEMGDHPIYSRFIQSLLHLLSEVKLCQQRCNIKCEDSETIDKGREVIAFQSTDTDDKDTAPYVQILPSLHSNGSWETRQIADSWTLEALVYCNKISPHSETSLDLKEVVVLEGIPLHTTNDEVAEWCAMVCDIYKSATNKLTRGSICVPHDPSESSVYSTYCFIKFADKDIARKALAVDISILGCSTSASLDNTNRDIKELYMKTAQKPPTLQVTPSYLMSTDSGFIKLRAGGKVYDLNGQIDTVMQSPMLATVSDQAFCVSFGRRASDEKYFDYAIPPNQWVNIAIVHHYSSSSSVSLYVNGELKDTIECQFTLLLSIIGSRGRYSLDGALADLRVWNYARSAGEIVRDMNIGWDASDIKGLFCYLTCDRTAGGARDLTNLYDNSSTLSVKVINCEYRIDDTCPRLRPISSDIKPFITNTIEAPRCILDERADIINFTDSSDVMEFTGILDKPGLYGVSGAAAESTHEVVSLCFRVLREQDGLKHVTGYMEWCERGGVRSLISGTIMNETDLSFAISQEHTCIIGVPENIAWLHQVSFHGSISGNGDLKGAFTVHVSAEISPLELDNVALDVVSIARSYRVSTTNSDTLISRLPVLLYNSIITVRCNPKLRQDRKALDSDVTRIASTPRVNHAEEKEEVEQCEEKKDADLEVVTYDAVFGMCEAEGSMWIEFEVVSPNSSPFPNAITFGVISGEVYNEYANSFCLDKALASSWCVSSYTGDHISHSSIYSPSVSHGDVLAIQIDSNNGLIALYRNDNCVFTCGNINKLPLMHMSELPCASNKLKGLRPFIHLHNLTETVKYKGAVQNRTAVKITYAADDSAGRVEYRGDIINGNFSGLSVLKCRLIDENTGLYNENFIEWYGLWDDGKRHGLHLGYECTGIFLVNKCVAVYQQGEYITEYAPPSITCGPVASGKEALPEPMITMYESLKQSYLSLSVTSTSSTPSDRSLTSAIRSSDVGGGMFVSSDAQQITRHDRTVRVAVLEVGRNNPIYFDIKAHSRMRKIFDAYARKRDVPVAALSYYINDIVISDDVTVESLQVDDEDFQIVAKVTPRTQTLDQLLATSTSTHILQIIYNEGAMVRKGIELDSASIRVIAAGDFVEAYDTAKACDGTVTRYKLLDGWISNILRDSGVPVVRIIRHLYKKPGLFKVVNSEGVSVSIYSSSSLSEVVLNQGDPLPLHLGTIINVSETRITDGIAPSYAVKISCDGLLAHGGQYWISDKYIEEFLDVAPIKAEIKAEIERRLAVLQRRKHREKTDSTSSGTTYSVPIVGSLELNKDTLFLLNPDRKRLKSQVSNDCTAYEFKNPSDSYPMIFGSKGFTRGVHYWEIHVDHTPHYNKETLFIGVAASGAANWKGHGFTNHRVLRTFDHSRLYGHNFNTHDTIGVLLDLDHGTLSFIKYGPDDSDLSAGRFVINMGIANRYINRGNSKYSISCFYPCIGARYNTEKMSVRKYYSLSQRGYSINRLLNQVVYGKTMISHWHCSYQHPVGVGHAFPKEFMHEVYSRYCSWIRSNTLVVRSRPGMDVVLDVNSRSFDALTPAITIQLHYGMKFSEKLTDESPFTIQGSIMGVSGGNKVWFESNMKGSVGAWYWHVGDLAALIATGFVQFDVEDDQTTYQQLRLGETGPPEKEISLDTFTEIFYQHQNAGRKEMDAEIAQLVTNIANALSIDASCIPARYLFNELQSKGFAPTASCIRYVFLVCMNSIASAVLPYTDFGVTDERHLQISTELCSAYCHFNPFLVSAHQFHALKSVIFLKTKTAYWNAVIRETVVATEAVQEIFEKPKDIDRDEIKVNRIEARIIERNKELRKRQGLSRDDIVRKSVFGQLQAAIKNFDDRKLRRKYTYILDGGQSRVFYVKLIGEDGDDNGGPYRTVFLDAIGDEAINTLELLKYVPDRVDKTVFNCQLLTHSSHSFYRDLFIHLGKLVSIACRNDIQAPLSLSSLIWKSLVQDKLELVDLTSEYDSVMRIIAAIEESHNTAMEDSYEYSTRTTHIETLVSAVELIPSSSSFKLWWNGVVRLLPTLPTQKYARVIPHIIRMIKTMKCNEQYSCLVYFYHGMSYSLPVELFPMFTPVELEELICGKVLVDLNMLKQTTIYEGVSPADRHIQIFWNVVDGMSSDELSSLVNFYSGSSRLPSNLHYANCKLKLVSAPSHTQSNPNSHLPTAQTCFFSLALPEYTSEEACRAKLIYAINNCVSMEVH